MKFTKLAYTGSLLIVGLGLAVNGYSQSFLTNGLVAYYPFNGNPNDASGHGNNGTVMGAQLAADRFGNTNSAYSFNGLTDYITIPDSPSLNPPTSISVSAWINVATSSRSCGIVAKFGADNNMMGQWALWQGNLQTPAGLQPGFNSQIVLGGGPPWFGIQADFVTPQVDHLWHQLTTTYDGSVVRLYEDGSAVASSSGGNGTLAVYAQAVEIGRWYHGLNNGGLNYYYSGLIDDVRIYNHALSASEVQQLYVIESGPRVDLIKAVKPSFSNLTLTTNYQMQISGDLSTWTNYGAVFTATNNSMVYQQYFDVDNWNSLFFRVKSVP